MLRGAERGDGDLDAEVRAVVQRLAALARLARAEHGDEHLREPVRDQRGAVRRALLREVDRDVAQLVLAAPVRAVAAVVEDFYAGGLAAVSARRAGRDGGGRTMREVGGRESENG